MIVVQRLRKHFKLGASSFQSEGEGPVIVCIFIRNRTSFASLDVMNMELDWTTPPS